jgi:uncharacterized protein
MATLNSWQQFDSKVRRAEATLHSSISSAENTAHQAPATPGRSCGFDRITSLPADYGAYERDWIDHLARRGPSRLGTPPVTETPPPVLAPLSGAASWVHLGVILTLMIAFACYPLAFVLSHIRRRPMASRRGGTQRLIVAAGLFTTLGLPVYLLFLMITAANVIGPVVLGRPLPWLMLQVSTVIVGVCTTVIAIGWWRSRCGEERTDHHRLILVASGAVLLGWAGYWGLLVP